MAGTNDDELLTVEEVAARLRISARTVARKLEEGRELRGVRVGKLWRVFASSLRALLESAAPTSPTMQAPPGCTMALDGMYRGGRR